MNHVFRERETARVIRNRPYSANLYVGDIVKITRVRYRDCIVSKLNSPEYKWIVPYTALEPPSQNELEYYLR